MSTSAIFCCPADLMKKVSLQYYLDFTMVTSHGSTCTCTVAAQRLSWLSSFIRREVVLSEYLCTKLLWQCSKRYGEVSPGWAFMLCNIYIVSPSYIPSHLVMCELLLWPKIITLALLSSSHAESANCMQKVKNVLQHPWALGWEHKLCM